MAVALNREQLKTLAGIFAVANKKHVPYKDLLSAVETAGVEANYGNPVGGGGTSSGWRQETKSSYPNVNRRNVHGAAKRFFDELAHAGAGSPGKRAQAVQRSAYPGRYDQREAEAKAIIARYDKGGRGVSRGALEQAGLATPGKVTAHDVTTTIPGSPNPVTEADPAATSELLSSLQSQQAVAALEPAPISPPAFTARYAMARLPGGGLPQLPASPPVQPPSQLDLSALEQLGVPADRSLGSSASQRVTGQVYTGTPGTAAEGAAGGGSGAVGRVRVAAGADRGGVSTQPIVKKTVALVAGRTHHPITITTGTNHSRMTVNGNVSDHWTGHAADIGVPVDSHQGDEIATAALEVAGYSRSQARAMARRGGLYTITPKSGPLKGKRVQVIWKTNQGGNHHNHVHIGVH